MRVREDWQPKTSGSQPSIDLFMHYSPRVAMDNFFLALWILTASLLCTWMLPCVLPILFVKQASWMSHKTRQMQHGVGRSLSSRQSVQDFRCLVVVVTIIIINVDTRQGKIRRQE